MRPCSSKVDAKPHQMLPHPQALTLHSLWCHLSLSSPLLVQLLAMAMATIAEQQSSSLPPLLPLLLPCIALQDLVPHPTRVHVETLAAPTPIPSLPLQCR